MKRVNLSLIILFLLFDASRISAQISIDYNNEHQIIEGFGGFGPRRVWWNSYASYYDAEYLDMIINDLGVNIVRTQLYWDIEEPNDNNDPSVINWSGFDFSPGSQNGRQLSFMTDLDTVPEMKQIASVWTPPVWMKLDVDDGLASFCHGQCGGYLNPAYYEEFAELCVAYVKGLKNEINVDLYGLSIQNELLYANAFESCVYTPAQFAEVLKVVGRRFKEEGLETKIFGPEHMGTYSGNVGLFEEVLDDPEARQYLDIYAVHGYIDGVNPASGSAPGWIQMNNRVREHGKQFWMTETSGGSANWDGAYDMGNSLMLALKYGQINAWVYWYMSGDLLVNNVPQKRYYAFKSFYKYIRPGAIMLECTSVDPDVVPVAFRNEEKGMLTVVIQNRSTTAKSTALNFELPENSEFYRTSATENFVNVSPLSGNEINLPPKSFTTLVAYSANKAPTIDLINDTTVLSSQGIIEIPLNNITNGGDLVSTLTSINFDADNPSLFNSSDLLWNEGENSGILRFTLNPDGYGTTQISIRLDEDSEAENGAFNSFKTRIFNLRSMTYINSAPGADPVEEHTYERLSGLQSIILRNVSDGNLNDGRESLKFSIKSRQSLCQSLSVKYTNGSDTAEVKFSPKTEGRDTLEITITDDFGTDLGGADNTTMIIPIVITPRSTGISQTEKQGMLIYPNPAGDYITIEAPGKIMSQLNLLDISGRLIYSKNLNPGQHVWDLDVSGLNQGPYIIVLKGKESELKSFFIKK